MRTLGNIERLRQVVMQQHQIYYKGKPNNMSYLMQGQRLSFTIATM